MKALFKGFSAQKSLPCALLFAQLLVELDDKVPPAFVFLALALKGQVTGMDWADPCEDLLPYSEEDRTFGDEVWSGRNEPNEFNTNRADPALSSSQNGVHAPPDEGHMHDCP